MSKTEKEIRKLEDEFYPPNLSLDEKELFLSGYKKGIEECKKIMKM